MEDIKTLLQQHEALKSKGLRLVDNDLHQRIWIMDQMLDHNIELDSEVDELKDEYEDKYDTEIILNKADWDTELLANSKARKKLKESKDNIRLKRKEKNRTANKAKIIEHYINLWKRVVK